MACIFISAFMIKYTQTNVALLTHRMTNDIKGVNAANWRNYCLSIGCATYEGISNR